MEIKKSYLKCEVSEGMFSNEKGVSFKDIKGRDIPGFWPNDCIKNGLLEVRVFEVGKENSLIFGPFTDGGGYGFFQGRGFYVSNDLIELSD
ncbi:hypothetical protein A3K82_03655 [Candidatus Pacearchaeota archaeon RBG_19FT_COMBO_34_9]|nr:MAG: hypothetical protein A3K82_03655 [Candidatus Pacearchaeota archaeon RBG_19FT_COMBO_34_9]OGJ16147.1 MAG: hypothetical protein A3K74_02865 [Candidatus Pacearchaeota archaeon RBG_13_33_26]